jgi:hypothetical protein
MAGCPPPIFGRPDKCPSSKWCHERNSVRYPEIMPVEENPGPFLLFLVRTARGCIRRERGVLGPYAEADYLENLEKILPFYIVSFLQGKN